MSDFSVNDMKPTARAVKDQEMAIKRAYDLNDGLIDALSEYGDLETLKNSAWSAIIGNTKLRDLLFNTIYWRDNERWCWLVDHWYSGALKRSVEDAMHNITDTNKKAIKRKIDELYQG